MKVIKRKKNRSDKGFFLKKLLALGRIERQRYAVNSRHANLFPKLLNEGTEM